jgi:stage II sporulation SpoE-like protein/GAF domain-containing protein
VTSLMPPTAVDAEEESRLRALHALGLVGTRAEERFDRITRLAQRLLGVPIAAITLVDRDTQWIKSHVGFPHDRTPRLDAFCNLTIAGGDTTVIADALADPQTARNPLVQGAPNVRFYAGHPLRAGSGGDRVGALCVLDSRPRAFDDRQLAILRELSSWAESELNRTAELDHAQQVQQALLPRDAVLEVPGWQVRAACWPARSVGGDFVDWYRTDDGGFAITLGDVMGKGMGAALLMATVRSVLRTAGRDHDPADAVAEAAHALEDDLARTGTMVTLCHARMYPVTGTLLAVDAGHGLTLTVKADGSVSRTPSGGGLPLGILPDERWPQRRVRLDPGDTAVAFSDGLLDLFPGVEETFDDVAAAARRDPAGIIAHIGRLVERAPLDDDVTVQVVHRCP